MLTEKEKKWLKKREQLPSLGEEGGYFCKYCCHATFAHGEFCCDAAPEEREEEDLGYCPTAYFREDSFFQVALFKDAAEFEARVAVKLAEHAGDIALTLQEAGLDQLEADKMLRTARFTVETEMEAESAGR